VLWEIKKMPPIFEMVQIKRHSGQPYSVTLEQTEKLVSGGRRRAQSRGTTKEGVGEDDNEAGLAKSPQSSTLRGQKPQKPLRGI